MMCVGPLAFGRRAALYFERAGVGALGTSLVAYWSLGQPLTACQGRAGSDQQRDETSDHCERKIAACLLELGIGGTDLSDRLRPRIRQALILRHDGTRRSDEIAGERTRA